MNPNNINLFQREIIDEVILEFDDNMKIICQANELFQFIRLEMDQSLLGLFKLEEAQAHKNEYQTLYLSQNQWYRLQHYINVLILT